MHSLVAKSLSGTAQAPALGNRVWDHRSGSMLGHELVRELGPELGPKLGRDSVGVGAGVNATVLPA